MAVAQDSVGFPEIVGVSVGFQRVASIFEPDVAVMPIAALGILGQVAYERHSFTERFNDEFPSDGPGHGSRVIIRVSGVYSISHLWL
jgi:hypothetical protein